MAMAAGGFGAIGPDNSASMRGLTVDYHESGFAAAASGENAMTLQQGFYFQLSNNDKQQAASPGGPMNLQALNRYSYVLNNPLRYTDPTGHYKATFYFGSSAYSSLTSQFGSATTSIVNGINAGYTIGGILAGGGAGAAVGLALGSVAGPFGLGAGIVGGVLGVIAATIGGVLGTVAGLNNSSYANRVLGNFAAGLTEAAAYSTGGLFVDYDQDKGTVTIRGYGPNGLKTWTYSEGADYILAALLIAGTAAANRQNAVRGDVRFGWYPSAPKTSTCEYGPCPLPQPVLPAQPNIPRL